MKHIIITDRNQVKINKTCINDHERKHMNIYASFIAVNNK